MAASSKAPLRCNLDGVSLGESESGSLYLKEIIKHPVSGPEVKVSTVFLLFSSVTLFFP
jgi:hypothetical protein